ncbi:hypothetical protein KP509_32G015000 [Ceratopteris richardii]|uniref:Nicotianamine synthase n=1 Tax=Ceratopteris richardii TaxID=49495 RepID=A0A8T2QSN2_CERRI|nr:hypothetical protein KP509_32G015000 [Ceratopteris richardii]
MGCSEVAHAHHDIGMCCGTNIAPLVPTNAARTAPSSPPVSPRVAPRSNPPCTPSWTVAISPKELVEQVLQLHRQIAALDDLHPSELVDALFSSLVDLCLHRCPINPDTDLNPDVQKVREDLIKLCGRAEGLLEHHYSALLGALDHPHLHLDRFPYYHNYVKLAKAEFRELCATACRAMPASPEPPVPKPPGCMSSEAACACVAFMKVAFVGSGPMPLTSIVLALNHMPWATFDNYDISAEANDRAKALVTDHPDLASRMAFITRDIKKVQLRLAEYDLVFLAALVGMDRPSKTDILHHLSLHMRAGATLVVRSAYASRAFLYPIVRKELLTHVGFDVLSEFHPTDEVVNSVIVARKRSPSLSLEKQDGSPLR